MSFKVIGVGTVAVAPELRFTQNGIPVCNLRVATQREVSNQGNRVSDFHDVVAWRQQAEFLANYVEVGSLVEVVGNLQNRSYQPENGPVQIRSEIQAFNVNHLRRPTRNEREGLLAELLKRAAAEGIAVDRLQEIAGEMLQTTNQNARTEHNRADEPRQTPVQPVLAGVVGGFTEDPVI